MAWMALAFPLMLLVTALSLDMGRLIMIDRRLQAALDAAAYAGANPGAGEILVYPEPVPAGQTPTFTVILNSSAAEQRARDIFNRSDLFVRPTTTPPTPLTGITVTGFNTTLLSSNTVEVTADISVTTFLIGAAFATLGLDDYVTEFRALPISGRAQATSVVR